ncbi:MAG: hypothetical protein ACR2NZ_00175 [Rubripirellula sp.]
MKFQSPSPEVESKRRTPRPEDRALRASRFDSVTAWLTSLMVMLGVLVTLLSIVWMLSGSRDSVTRLARSPQVVWGTVNPPGLERDFLEPGAEETVELEVPQIRETLVAVSDLVSTVSGDLLSGHGLQTSDGRNHQGDSRPPGPENGLQDIVPRFQRWQLDFEAKDIFHYARQLDHFRIELGLIGGTIQGVDYVRGLAGPTEVRRGDAESEKRLYFMWTRPSPLKQFDRQLLLAAGADVEGREMLKFIPEGLETQLARIELEYAMAHGRDSAQTIAKTVFSSRPTADGFQFIVVEQRYRERIAVR